MNLEKIHTVYFVGIGGIGMSALARYFNANGKRVLGYDKTETKLTASLISEGISITFKDDVDEIPEDLLVASDSTLVVYTPAIPKESHVLTHFSENSFQIYKRSVVLGLITQHHFTTAVAGTHGKTTASSMVAHLLNQVDGGCSAFLGGIAVNYNSNLLLGKSDHMVVEADEYDRSFLTLNPNITIITSMDPDHLDIYGAAENLEKTFIEFASKTTADGNVLLHHSLKNKPVFGGEKVYTYGIGSDADWSTMNLRVENGHYLFDLISPIANIFGVALKMGGIHNVENSIAAIAAAQLSGLDGENIKTTLESYRGVKRRFEYQIETEDVIYIDDYAHHPKEIETTLKSARSLYPGKKISVIFQPHLFSRTRDFEGEFARTLALADELFLLDIYPAREQPIEGISSKILLEKVALEHKKLVTPDEMLKILQEKRVEVLFTLGAGDIDKLVEPIKNVLGGTVTL
ncbi:MAG: UDP-N-acetylmuramate--alanine ligase [Sphingobacteriales bacterium]